MAYGHAERNLAFLRQLEAETRQLLQNLGQPDPEQPVRLQEVADEAGVAGMSGCVPAGSGDDRRVRLFTRAPGDLITG
jgi:hypothetical protein